MKIPLIVLFLLLEMKCNKLHLKLVNPVLSYYLRLLSAMAFVLADTIALEIRKTTYHIIIPPSENITKENIMRFCIVKVIVSIYAKFKR